MKKILIFLGALISMYSPLQAQTISKKHNEWKNTVSADMGMFNFFNVFSQTRILPSVVQFNYWRRVTKDFSIGGGYSYWTKNSIAPSEVDIHGSGSWNLHDGDFYSVEGLQCFDINVKYTKQIYDHHMLYVSAGPSYSECKRGYVVSSTFISIPGKGEHMIDRLTDAKKSSQFGAVISAGYNYNFFKDYFSAGVVLRARYYDVVPFHIIYGISLGVNF